MTNFERNVAKNLICIATQFCLVSKKEEANGQTWDIFDHCCLTWMAWAPGAPCSHGFFSSTFPETTLLASSAGEPPPVGGFPPRGAHIFQKKEGRLVGCPQKKTPLPSARFVFPESNMEGPWQAAGPPRGSVARLAIAIGGLLCFF